MVFDPTPTRDDAVLVASFDDNSSYVRPSYEAAQAAREQDFRERTYGSLMRQRTSVCG